MDKIIFIVGFIVGVIFIYGLFLSMNLQFNNPQMAAQDPSEKKAEIA